VDIPVKQEGTLSVTLMKQTFGWIGITTAAMFICLESASVAAITQQNLNTHSVPGVVLAQRRPFRRNFGAQDVIRVPILERVGGIPVIAVTLNGRQTFPMMIDTGASLTVITQEMADAINFREQGKEAIIFGNGQVQELPRGNVSSIHVGDAVMDDFTVLVGSAPLLGQNFFADYNVTIRENFVFFRPKIR
jgi:predicted aspartyl protease